MPFNILIADSGSTKAEWSVITAAGNRKIITQGISPYFQNTSAIIELLRKEMLEDIGDVNEIREIHYYGTGCTAPSTIAIIYDALKAVFPQAHIHIDYDLVAAAHALCGNEKGIACILGTGSNSCYYNGKTIERNSPGLGYILGDEGSGAYLGKKLITEYLYGKLPRDLEESFARTFVTNKDSLLEQVYITELPNRFLASFSIFFAQNRGNLTLEKILMEGIEDFFSLHILSYPESNAVPVHFTGSIAFIYKDILSVLCTKHDLVLGKVIKEPMEGLIDYHRRQIKPI